MVPPSCPRRALIQYETIDADQIDDIMAGRKPRPPSDWDSSSGGATPGAGVDPKPKSKDAGRPIGGPASEH